METHTLRKGFTLLEILVVVAVIGLLLLLGIPNLRQARQKTQRTRFACDIKTAGHAFAQNAANQGGYPADTQAGKMPNGMAEYLSGFPWNEDTIIGGRWEWDYMVHGITAGVSVKSPNFGLEQMQQIDATIDDGDLSTGLFRQRPGGYIYILEE